MAEGAVGTSAEELVVEPAELVERLAALVPPPRVHLARYHGILVPRRRSSPASHYPRALRPSVGPRPYAVTKARLRGAAVEHAKRVLFTE